MTVPPRVPLYARPPLCHVDLMEAFLAHVFGCPQSISLAFSSRPNVQLRPYLEQLFPPKSPPPKWIIYGSLLLLNRLKEKHSDTTWEWAIRLFVPSLMVAAKFLSDMCPWKQIHWSRYVSCRELKEWERAFCRLLDWDLTLELRELEYFEQRLKQDFYSGNKGKPGGWPVPARKGRMQNPSPPMPDSSPPKFTTSAPSFYREPSIPKPLYNYPAPPTYAAPPPYDTTVPPMSFPPCPPVPLRYHSPPPSPFIPPPCPSKLPRSPCPPLLPRYHASAIPSPCPLALPQHYVSAIPSSYESIFIPPRYSHQYLPTVPPSCAPVTWTQLVATSFCM